MRGAEAIRICHFGFVSNFGFRISPFCADLPRKSLFFAVVFYVALRRLRRVMQGMKMVAVCQVRMVRGLLVVSGLMVFCRFLVMPSGVLMMFGRLGMMCCCFACHPILLSSVC
jgi:hypothetical protein